MLPRLVHWTRSWTSSSIGPLDTSLEFKSLVIVDESLASGRTVAAMLHHLRQAGLPKDCVVYVAVAAYLAGEDS